MKTHRYIFCINFYLHPSDWTTICYLKIPISEFLTYYTIQIWFLGFMITKNAHTVDRVDFYTNDKVMFEGDGDVNEDFKHL